MAELVDVAGIQLQPHQLDYEVDDESTRQFLDSLDNYITLLDSLSSTLGQGWLQLAGARHSMGATRINSALLNLQPHNAVTQLQVARDQDQPQFSLCKWASCAGIDSGEAEVQDEMQKNFESLTTEDRGSSSSPEPRLNSSSTKLPTLDAEKQVQRERLKSLAVFGTLVPPRLRDSQLSFEKALETVVEIANAQSSMLYAFGKLQKEVKRREAADKWGNKMDD